MRDDGSLLEGALTRPTTSLGNVMKYPTVEMAGAALVHSLVLDHAFHNGNKRTAVVCLAAFLDLNGYVLTARDDEMIQFLIDVAEHKFGSTSTLRNADVETVNIAKWIASHSRKLSAAQQNLKYHSLMTILRRYGCEDHHRDGNAITITRGALQTFVGARNDGDEVNKATVARIRRDLRLEEVDGIDSDIFYYDAERIPPFISRYRKVLRELAYL